MALSILVLLLISWTTSIGAQEVDHRLPTTVVPEKYQLHLNLTEDTFTSEDSEYTGIVIIDIRAIQPVSQISLHASYDFITINLLAISNIEIASSGYSINNVTDILTITVPGTLGAGSTSSIYIEFTSRLSTNDMYGFYKSSYTDSQNVTQYLATTQFQPTYARRAFPCFDEPAYKAIFDLYITFPPDMNALANTDGSGYDVSTFDNSSLTLQFETTPVMSTYLLAFVVSNFTCTLGEYIEYNDTVPYQICSREEAADTRAWSVEIGPALLRSLNEFTGFNYSQAIAKLDQVAIPDFAAGAMENWGLVTYRETLLLFDEEHSSNANKQSITTVISHEFGHMWFGNLVTVQWWSELFLNEGFATYFEFFTTHDVLPDWELDKQFVVRVLQAVFVNDASEASQPLVYNVSTAAEVLSRFSAVSYSKGGSILRMVEHFMGTENFKAGLQYYLDTHQYGTTQPEDLWTALSSTINETLSLLPADLSTVMDNWINNPGFPVLFVQNVGISVVVTQERFLISGNDSTSRWYVPVSYTLSSDTDKFANTLPNDWAEPLGFLEIDYPNTESWIILNNQVTGFYRVNYDEDLWQNISTALLSADFDGIGELNRAQIVDDAFNLARSDQLKYSTVFNIIRFLANETSYHTWFAAFRGFDFLVRRFGLDSTLGTAIGNHILQLMSTLHSDVPITVLNDTNHVYTLKQTLSLSWACRLGHGECTNAVLERFGEYRITSERPHRNLREVIYCNALRYSTNISDWSLLWNAYLNTDIATEKATLITALGCTQNVNQLNNYLYLTLEEDSGIRSQDALSVFASVYNANPIGVDVAFQFLIDNHEAIAERYSSLNAMRNIITGIAERFTTQTQLEQLRNFTLTDNLPEELSLASAAALEIAESNLEWVALFEDDLIEYYGLNEVETTTLTVPPTNATTAGPVDPVTDPSETEPETTTTGDATRISISILLISITVIANKLF